MVFNTAVQKFEEITDILCAALEEKAEKLSLEAWELLRGRMLAARIKAHIATSPRIRIPTLRVFFDGKSIILQGTVRRMADLEAIARSLDMAVLVETHSEEEIQRALRAGAHIIGINNRDLDTLEVDIQTTMRLKNRVPGGNILVSESGIKTRREVRLLDDCGVDAILIGDSLLTSKNIREKLESLLHDDEG